MNKKEIAAGTVHGLPDDLRKALLGDDFSLSCWEDLTPLARNEWICWVEASRKPETRRRRIERVCEELREGKRRPCCWGGCPHREKKSRRK